MTGRNDLCPCGSGAKYKRCCLRCCVVTGRNDLCPCGSGAKYKRCCLGKAVDCGPCVAPGGYAAGPLASGRDAPVGMGRCGEPSCGAVGCNLCGKRYARCHQHHAQVQQMLRGHVLRVHPEAVPRMVDKLARNSVELAEVLEQARAAPELWGKLEGELRRRMPAS